MEQIIFKFVAYAAIGIFIEVVVTATTNFLNTLFHTIKEKWTDKTKTWTQVWKEHFTKEELKLKGWSYLWMLPCYALLLTFIYEPVYTLIIGFPFIIRYAIWGVSFVAFEYLWGWVCWKLAGDAPWKYDIGYPLPKDKGWTALYTIPLWGLAGFFLEWYSPIIRGLFK